MFFSHYLWEKNAKKFSSYLLNLLDIVGLTLFVMAKPIPQKKTLKVRIKKKKKDHAICPCHAKLAWYFGPVLQRYLSQIALLFALSV